MKLRTWLPSRPFAIVGLSYVIGMLLFGVIRLLFFLHFSELSKGVPLGEILRAFAVGFRSDQMVILQALAPLVTILPWVPNNVPVVKRLLFSYLILFFAISSLLLLADIRFYHYFDTHLNYIAVQYVDQGPLEI